MVTILSMAELKIGLDEWCFSNHLMGKKMDHFDILKESSALKVQVVALDYFLMPSKAKSDPQKVKAELDKYGLDLVLGFGMPFALPQALGFLLGGEEKKFLRMARVCGVQTVRVVGGVVAPIKGFRPLHLSLGKELEIQQVSANLKGFCRRLAPYNLKVALEYHMDYTAAQMLEILERVAEENFGFTLDTGNALHIGEDPLKVAKILAPFSYFTHIKDMRRVGNHAECVPLGEGSVPLREILHHLEEISYKGVYCLENALKPDEISKEREYAQKGIDWLREALKANSRD